MLASVLAAAISIAEARAQSREVHLGTITTREAESAGSARIAADMLADALTALEQGDVMLGRRHLEVLVGRYPESLAASAARRELARLYNDQSVASAYARNQRRAGASDEPARTPPSGYAPVRSIEASAGETPVDHVAELRRRQALVHDFQSTAGDRVFFSDSSVDLGARARTVLAAQARWLQRHPDQPVTVEAHADDRGSHEANVDLSQRRGAAVRDRLVEEGVAPARIVVRAYGRDQPIATCSAAECAAQNRRVVTAIGDDASHQSGSRARVGEGLATADYTRLRKGD